jgi:hypothetical protein
MDREEAIKLLKGGKDGIEEWNRACASGEAIPDLSGADLRRADLSAADLRRANLYGADFTGAILREVILSGANLSRADLSGANLSRADLSGAILTVANLRQANLNRANLSRANLSGANVCAANVCDADLHWANLREADLRGADLGGAKCWATSFDNLDLSEIQGLDSIRHEGPSTVGIDTLASSNGKVPESFLRGCGVPETLIAYLPSLLRSTEPIQFYSCFISHSSANRDFAERLHSDLQVKGVRCWFAPHDLKTGDRFRARIDESIHSHDKLLVVLSESSIASQEVEAEVEAAMDKEKSQGGTVLFPIRLDDAVIKARSGWAALVRRSRQIADFAAWKDLVKYQVAFARLLRDLAAEISSGSIPQKATPPETPR